MSPRYRPTLETLERRCVPAVIVTTSIDLDSDGQTDDLRIVGDAKKNQIIIDDDGTTLLIDVDKNGDGDFTDSGELLDLSQSPADGSIAIEISLGDGDDVVDYSFSNDLNAQRRALSVDLGLGNDLFDMGHGGDSLTNSSALLLDLLAGGGSDTLEILPPLLDDSMAAIQVAAGGGSDELTFQVFPVSAQGHFGADLDLGSGNNECVLGIFGGSLDGSVDVNVLGSASATQSDLVTLTLGQSIGNGSDASALSVDVNLQAGNDQFQGSLSNSAFDVADFAAVDLLVRGGAGNDQLSLDQFNAGSIIIDPDALLDLAFKGGAGNDSITVDLSDPSLNLDGRLRLRVEGNEGGDTITVNIQLLAGFIGSIGNLDIAIFGNSGNDTVNYELEANGAAVTFDPAGVALLNGGLGSDTLNDDSLNSQSDHNLFEVFV